MSARARAIERRVPRLTVRVAPGAPDDAVVRRDGIEMHAAAFGLALPVNPGEHTLEIAASGRAPRRVTTTLREGESREVTLEPGAPAVAPAPPPRAAETPKPAARGGSTATLGFVALGAGALAIGASAVTGVMAMSRKSTMDGHCNAAGLCDSAGFDAAQSGRTLSTVSTIAAIGGVVGGGLGAVLVLSSPRSGATDAVGITAAPRGAAMAWTRRF